MRHRFSGHSITCFRGERFVFEGLDFAIESGGVLILTGPNGSGKSSLIRIMANLLRPFEGRMEWDGEAVDEAPEEHHERLLYVAYQDAIKPVMTVRENLTFWAGLKGPTDLVDEALRTVGIEHLADTPAQFLSSGQRRRLSLARLVACRTTLWLLDEPTVGLDRSARGMLERLIVEHRGDGGMVVMATHQPVDAGGGEASLDIAEYVARRQIFDDAEATG